MCILIDCMQWSSWFKSVPWVNAIVPGSYNNTPPPYAFSIQITALSPLLAQKHAENECVEAPWHLSQCLLCSFSCSPWKATTTTVDKGRRENVLQNKVTVRQTQLMGEKGCAVVGRQELCGMPEVRLHGQKGDSWLFDPYQRLCRGKERAEEPHHVSGRISTLVWKAEFSWLPTLNAHFCESHQKKNHSETECIYISWITEQEINQKAKWFHLSSACPKLICLY